MMDFKEFTARAEQDIRAALEDASPGVGVGMNPVEKLQGESYTAMKITAESSSISRTITGTVSSPASSAAWCLLCPETIS